MAKRRAERVRPGRVAEQIRMDVADILQNELKDPRLGLITLTRVDVTNDLKHAKLYVSILAEEPDRTRIFSALQGATAFVRRRLSARLVLRATPEIRFVFDPSVEYGIRLEELIARTKANRPNDSEPDEGS